MYDPTIIARAENLNPKDFPIGSIVYFLRMENGKNCIGYGTVLEHYSSEVAIQLYEYADMRKICGVPVKEFVTPSKWSKLPKGWTYNTVLFKTEDDASLRWELRANYSISNPEDIKRAIDNGFLVRVAENDHAHFNAEIDKTKGWRIIRNYPYGEQHPDCICVFYQKCYATYAEAQAELNAINAELKRQSELSDEEWSVEQIDHIINRWASLCGKTDEEKTVIRERLLALDNVEDIETRLVSGRIEWKYAQNKRWIALDGRS